MNRGHAVAGSAGGRAAPFEAGRSPPLYVVLATLVWFERDGSVAIVRQGVVSRQTSDSGAHAAGSSGGKGGSSPRDAGRCCPFRRGVVSVSREAAASVKGAHG